MFYIFHHISIIIIKKIILIKNIAFNYTNSKKKLSITTTYYSMIIFNNTIKIIV